jgi:hypothetical protein
LASVARAQLAPPSAENKSALPDAAQSTWGPSLAHDTLPQGLGSTLWAGKTLFDHDLPPSSE